MTIDKFNLYLASADRRILSERRALVQDTLGAIAGAFGKDGSKKYLEQLEASYGTE